MVGGLLRTLELIDTARRNGLGVIVGAHIGESSLLTRAGLTAATAAGSDLVAHEGALGTRLLEDDISDDPITFGRRGRVGKRQLRALEPYGLGVAARDERLR